MASLIGPRKMLLAKLLVVGGVGCVDGLFLRVVEVETVVLLEVKAVVLVDFKVVGLVEVNVVRRVEVKVVCRVEVKAVRRVEVKVLCRVEVKVRRVEVKVVVVTGKKTASEPLA